MGRRAVFFKCGSRLRAILVGQRLLGQWSNLNFEQKMSLTWSTNEIDALKHAVLEISASIDKQERWRQISLRVGTRGKREVCFGDF
jgi:hypothetical protein